MKILSKWLKSAQQINQDSPNKVISIDRHVGVTPGRKNELWRLVGACYSPDYQDKQWRLHLTKAEQELVDEFDYIHLNIEM